MPIIAKSLTDRKINLQWNIVGEPDEKKIYPWDSSINVIFHGLIANAEANRLLCKMQYFILPSIAEGMPVSLIESMKAGVIPIVNNLPGGIQELVSNGVTGLLVDGNKAEGFVAAIETIVHDKVAVEIMKSKCKLLVNELFNPVINSRNFESIYLLTASKPVLKKSAKKIYGSRLDNAQLPNRLVTFLRNILYY